MVSAMALMLPMFLVVISLRFTSATVNDGLKDDIQTEIRIMKEDIKGIKDTQDMSKIAMMGMSQMVKGIDSRVNDVAKESSQMSQNFLKLKEKQEQNHEETIMQGNRLEKIESQSTSMAKKLSDVSLKENGNEEQIKDLKHQAGHLSERILSLAEKEVQDANRNEQEIKVLKEKTEAMKNITEEKIHSHEKRMDTSDRKFDSLDKKMDTSDRKVDSLEQSIQAITGQLKEFSQRGMVDILHPKGSIYISFVNIQPPMNGQYGIKWELLPEGYTLMTANGNNVGSRNGYERLDGGYTQGHAITIDQMPSHSHQYHTWSLMQYVGADTSYSVPRHDDTGTTTSAGGNEPHTHQLSIRNQKILVWRRTA